MDQNKVNSLLRLMRISRSLRLYPDSRNMIYDNLLAECQMMAKHHGSVTDNRFEPVTPKGTMVTTSLPSTAHQIKINQNSRFFRLLQQEIDQGSSWPVLQKTLKQWWHKEPSRELSVKILEMAYIWSGVASFLDTLLWFHKATFWRDLHQAIRRDVLCKYSRDRRVTQVLHDLKTEVYSEWLLPIERFVVFHMAIYQKNHPLIFKLHSRFARELDKSCHHYGSHLGITIGEMKYAVALARLEQGYLEEALNMVKTILPSDQAYQPASKLKRRIMMQKKNHQNSKIHSKIIEDVVSKNDWDRKEKTLRYYLEKIRVESNDAPMITPIINEILAKDSLAPNDMPSALSRFVGMCLEYFDLYQALPNILSILNRNVYQFHTPVIDGAIWDHFLHGDIPDFPCEPWRGVALFHRFMASGPE
ncbi:MAG: hypothetical protein OXC40_02775, partial [Proteobacteria bacterium]|nr:hypothetical protein [Pseudomonadota bacterium]